MNYKITNAEMEVLNFLSRYNYRGKRIYLGALLSIGQIQDLIDRNIIILGRTRNYEITFKGLWCLYLYHQL